jgi:hypothetical protein
MNSAVVFSHAYGHSRARTRGINRVVLQLGLAMVTWSRRSQRPEPDRDEQVRRHDAQLARAAALDEREAALTRQLYLVIR